MMINNTIVERKVYIWKSITSGFCQTTKSDNAGILYYYMIF